MMISMVYFTVKDELSVILSRHFDICAPNVDVHHDLIGPLALLYVSEFLDHDDVGNVEVVEIRHACHIDGYISQMVFCCFLPHSWSKVLSFCFFS